MLILAVGLLCAMGLRWAKKPQAGAGATREDEPPPFKAWFVLGAVALGVSVLGLLLASAGVAIFRDYAFFNAIWHVVTTKTSLLTFNLVLVVVLGVSGRLVERPAPGARAAEALHFAGRGLRLWLINAAVMLVLGWLAHEAALGEAAVWALSLLLLQQALGRAVDAPLWGAGAISGVRDDHPLADTALDKDRSPARLWVLALVALASLYPFWVASQAWRFLGDDAYITLTYAKCIADGRGFVFNHPPPTLGTTTPFFALTIGLLGRAMRGVDVSQIAAVFTALCWVGTAWLVVLFRKRFGLSQVEAAIVACVVLFSVYIASTIGNPIGAEALVFSFLLTLSIALAVSRCWFAAGITTGLLFLTRGEGALLGPILAVFALITSLKEKPKNPLAHLWAPCLLALGFALPVLAWFLYAKATFGHFLPHTLEVKMAQGRAAVRPTFVQRLPYWASHWGGRFPGVPQLKYLFWALAFLGLVFPIYGNPRWYMFLIWGYAYVIGYAALGVRAYHWYQKPLQFVWILLVGLGIVALIRVLTRMPRTKRALGRAVAALIAAAGLGFPLAGNVWRTLHYEGDPRAPSYLSACQWLREHTKPEESVVAGEIGYVGYFTDKRIIDLAGLIMPEACEGGEVRGTNWILQTYEPDCFFTAWQTPEEGRNLEDHFSTKAGEYRLVHFVQPSETDRGCAVYKRSNAPVSSDDSAAVRRLRPRPGTRGPTWF